MDTAAPSTSPAGAQLGTFGATFLGAVLLVSVVAKVPDVHAFAGTIHARGLDSILPAATVAYIALALETFVGVLLILGVRRRGFLLFVSALVAFLLWINLQSYLAWSKGAPLATTACGCFGNLLQRTPAEALWQDALLVLPALLLSFVGRPRGSPTAFPAVRVGLAAVVVVLVLVATWWAPRLPLDDLPLVTRLRPGVPFDRLCTGRGKDRACLADETVAPEIAEGVYVVVLADLANEAAVDEMRARVAAEAAAAHLLLIHAGTAEEEAAFVARTGLAAEDVRRAPYPLLRTLYRRLPRAFLVEDGQVVRTWNVVAP